MKIISKLIRSVWLFAMLIAFGPLLPIVASGFSVAPNLFAYDEPNQARIAYDRGSLSAFKYDLATVLITGGNESRTTEASGVLTRIAEFLAAKGGTKLLNPGINVTEQGMQHVLERHIVNGIPEFAGKSKFTTGVNLQELIQQATQMPMVRQANGNFARTFDAGRAIGLDRATGQASSTVTIITRPNGNLVTMFPGVP